MTEPPRRRPPPPLRPAEVETVERVGERWYRARLTGLDGLEINEPAASVRLLLPEPEGLVVPDWNGNEFLLPDGRRPGLRTLTPVKTREGSGSMELWIVRHGDSRLVRWCERAQPGDPVAISGPGRGHRFSTEARAHLLAGDESALAAITQLVAALPPGVPTTVRIEGSETALPRPFDPRAGVTVEWIGGVGLAGAALVHRIVESPLPDGVHVWAAGEAAAMQRLRRHLFEQRGLPRGVATVRGYWKHGRTGT